MEAGCLAAQLDELLVAAALVEAEERTLLAEDLERVGLAGQLAELDRPPGESLAVREVAFEEHPRRHLDLRHPDERGLSEGRRELLHGGLAQPAPARNRMSRG